MIDFYIEEDLYRDLSVDTQKNQPALSHFQSHFKSGFHMALETGKHNKQFIPFLAITPGNHELPDGTKIKVAQSHIINFKAGAGVSGTQGWHTINF